MMKKRFVVILCFSLLVSPFAHAESLLQQAAPIGAGGILMLYGLKLIHKSTKKKGTASQGLIGAAATFGGGYFATHGPKHIRSQNKNWLNWLKQNTEKIPFVGKIINPHSYTENKKIAQIKYTDLSNNESSLLKKAACYVYLALLQYDPFEMIPVENPQI